MRQLTIIAMIFGLFVGATSVRNPAFGGELKFEASGSGAGQIAVFRFSGPLLEAPPEFDFGLSLEPQRTLYDVMMRFRQAAGDPDLKAVVLTFEDPMIGWAQAQELRSMIAGLRAADKDVYCYLEEPNAMTYQIATAASRVCMMPSGFLDLTGLYVEQVYFKNLMDNIRVEADVEYVGEYKGAGEPFTRTGPSEEAREMLDWLLDDLFDQMIETISNGRQIPKEEVRSLIDQGPFTAEQAVEAKLVDELKYADQFAAGLRARYGQTVDFEHNYGAKEVPEIDFSSPFAIFKFLGETMQKVKPEPASAIAVVYIDGMIMTGQTERGLFGGSGMAGSTTIRRVLQRAQDDASIKAVVLRVDSPGGSAVASDIIWHASTALQDEKPVIVSMGNVAASGGYYVSCGAATIFADAGSITGSIGVVGGKLITKGLWNWIGLTFHESKYGQNADLFNSNRRFDEREREVVREILESVYTTFTDRVKQGREDRLKKDLEELAGGRVFTGRQAQANGLVDRVGGLSDAIKFAAAEANISDYEIRRLPEPENFFDALIKSFTGQADEERGDIAVSLKQRFWTLNTPAIRDILPALQQLDPARVQAFTRSLLRIELLGREPSLVVMPGEITIGQ